MYQGISNIYALAYLVELYALAYVEKRSLLSNYVSFTGVLSNKDVRPR